MKLYMYITIILSFGAIAHADTVVSPLTPTYSKYKSIYETSNALTEADLLNSIGFYDGAMLYLDSSGYEHIRGLHGLISYYANNSSGNPTYAVVPRITERIQRDWLIDNPYAWDWVFNMINNFKTPFYPSGNHTLCCFLPFTNFENVFEESYMRTTFWDHKTNKYHTFDIKKCNKETECTFIAKREVKEEFNGVIKTYIDYYIMSNNISTCESLVLLPPSSTQCPAAP